MKKISYKWINLSILVMFSILLCLPYANGYFGFHFISVVINWILLAVATLLNTFRRQASSIVTGIVLASVHVMWYIPIIVFINLGGVSFSLPSASNGRGGGFHSNASYFDYGFGLSLCVSLFYFAYEIYDLSVYRKQQNQIN